MSTSSDRPKKKKRERKQATPKKLQKKTKVTRVPLWTCAPGPIGHAGLETVLAKPFLATIFIDPAKDCFRFPVEGLKEAHTLGGLHVRMRQKFFKGASLPVRHAKKGKEFRRLPSSKVDGKRADNALEKAIETGNAPPATSKYAAAVWKYWQENGHRPVLAQLPVVLPKQNIATAGDYFTVKDGKLWLWELKTGWPFVYKTLAEAGTMSEPLDHVWATPWNRWQLQVLITQLAYQRELGLEIDGGARVIHAWLERPFGEHGYSCHVRVHEPDTLEPPGWPDTVNKDALYGAI